jgi:hypothetical protein
MTLQLRKATMTFKGDPAFSGDAGEPAATNGARGIP